MNGTRLRRRLVSVAAVGFCALSVVLALVPLGFILFFVLKEGLPALTFDFLTRLPKPVGETGGGMGNAIVGSSILIALGGLIAVPVGIVSGIHVAEFRAGRLATVVRFASGHWAPAYLWIPRASFSPIATWWRRPTVYGCGCRMMRLESNTMPRSLAPTRKPIWR